MTPGTSLTLLVGLALALFGPRIGRTLLACFVAVLVLLVLSWRAGVGEWSFFTTAVLLLLLNGALVWLVARRPRFGLAPALFVALVTGVVPMLVGTGSQPSAPAIALAVVCLLLALWGVFRPALGIRFATAAMGARLVLTALPGETAGWQWPVFSVVLFALGCLVSSHVELGPGSRRLSHRAARLAAVLTLACLAAVALFTPELREPSEHTERLARLRARALRGGYLWPELVETIAWEDSTGYRLWDSLDVRYLTASAQRGLFRLPGTSRLFGRFSLNHDVGKLRGVKDASELRDLEVAAHAIVTAVREVAPGRTPGVTEASVAQAIQRSGLANGCTEDSFPPVVAGGARAASPHAAPTLAVLQVGEMVVVDVGCSVNHYASDFTRTFPVGGHYTKEHRKAYEAVYAAQQAALAACRPGATISGKGSEEHPSLDAIAHRVLQERLGLKGYSHGLGHGVGLFVHDAGTGGPLEPGMVLTIEPGLYLPGDLGIRIEDTYRVTDTGCVQLTSGLSADPDAIEAFLAGPAPDAVPQRVTPQPSSVGGAPAATTPAAR